MNNIQEDSNKFKDTNQKLLALIDEKEARFSQILIDIEEKDNLITEEKKQLQKIHIELE
jgi:hypothetical protein